MTAEEFFDQVTEQYEDMDPWEKESLGPELGRLSALATRISGEPCYVDKLRRVARRLKDVDCLSLKERLDRTCRFMPYSPSPEIAFGDLYLNVLEFCPSDTVIEVNDL